MPLGSSGRARNAAVDGVDDHGPRRHERHLQHDVGRRWKRRPDLLTDVLGSVQLPLRSPRLRPPCAFCAWVTSARTSLRERVDAISPWRKLPKAAE